MTVICGNPLCNRFGKVHPGRGQFCPECGGSVTVPIREPLRPMISIGLLLASLLAAVATWLAWRG